MGGTARPHIRFGVPRTSELHEHEPIAQRAVRRIRHGREQARPPREVNQNLVVGLRPLTQRRAQNLIDAASQNGQRNAIVHTQLLLHT
jgi:hypothetical protein